ncbi:MAG: hypothetical protein J0H66_09110 [Solirubrobacterales bacterium]|nr:hypothetical protein [Solirubrobacterales bacterium]
MKSITSCFAVLLLLLLPSVASGNARLDPSFGKNGFATVHPPGSTSSWRYALDVVEGRGGKLTTLVSGGPFSVARFSADGNPDRSFGADGFVSTKGSSIWGDRFATAGYGGALGVTSEGGTVVAGLDTADPSGQNWTGDCAFIAQLLPNGKIDKSFARHGKRRTCLHRTSRRSRASSDAASSVINLGSGSTVGLSPASMDVTGSGKILVGGMVLSNWRDTGAFVARFNANGALDRTFEGGPGSRSGERGIAEIRRRKDTEADTFDVRSLRHRKVLAVGSYERDLVVVRLNAKGFLDPGFGNLGIVKVKRRRLQPDDHYCYPTDASSAFDRRGRVVVAGTCWSDRTSDRSTYVLRLHKNGRLDRSFGNDGIDSLRFNLDFSSSGVAIQRDGRIVVSGELGPHISEGSNIPTRFALVRLTRNGTRDRSFFDRGLFTPKFTYEPGYPEPSGFKPRQLGHAATDVLIDRRGRIVASGGDESPTLVRILPR